VPSDDFGLRRTEPPRFDPYSTDCSVAAPTQTYPLLHLPNFLPATPLHLRHHSQRLQTPSASLNLSLEIHDGEINQEEELYLFRGFAAAGTNMRKSIFASRSDPQQTYSIARLGFSWPISIPIPIPHRLRRRLRSKIRSRQSPSNNFTHLQTSYNPRDTLRSLAEHDWSYYDGQYLILLILGIFSLCIIPSPGPLVKTAISTIIITALILPVTRQFLLPSLAIWMWLIFFYACG